MVALCLDLFGDTLFASVETCPYSTYSCTPSSIALPSVRVIRLELGRSDSSRANALCFERESELRAHLKPMRHRRSFQRFVIRIARAHIGREIIGALSIQEKQNRFGKTDRKMKEHTVFP